LAGILATKRHKKLKNRQNLFELLVPLCGIEDFWGKAIPSSGSVSKYAGLEDVRETFFADISLIVMLPHAGIFDR
jgi:hypothetical protein